jgi:hypothetical protein
MRVDDGYVGNFSIDRYGDTTRTNMGVYKGEDGRLRFQTAITPPAGGDCRLPRMPVTTAEDDGHACRPGCSHRDCS